MSGSEPNPRFTLTLEAGADPNARHGERYARTPDYRLKLLLKFALRVLGLRCVVVTSGVDARPENPRPLESTPGS